MLILFGDRRSRAILAAMAARRSSGRQVFFVAPHIAEYFGLTPRDLHWALDALEDIVVQTVGSKQGKFRKIRLLSKWEAQLACQSGNQKPEWTTGNREGAEPGTASGGKPKPDAILDDPNFQQALLSAAREHRLDSPARKSPHSR
jgi:hypothetical protein